MKANTKRMSRGAGSRFLALAVLAVAGGFGVMSTFADRGDPGEAPKPATQGAEGGRGAPGGLMDRAGESGAQIYVDDSFASVEKLRTAIRLASQNRPMEAIPAFQDIIDNFGQKLVYLNNDGYVSITDYVREKLLAMPAVQQGMYDQLFGSVAESQVDAAIATRDLAGLIRTCDRYYPSAAAYKGLGLAAEWYFERGEFSNAARLWQLLMSHPKSKGVQADLLFRAAMAENLSGNLSGAKRLRDRLAKDFPKVNGTLDGESTELLPVLNEKLAAATWERTVIGAEEWPTFGGAPSRNGLLNVNSSAGARLWGIELDDPTITGVAKGKAAKAPVRNNRVYYGAQQPVDPNAQQLDSFPTLANGSLFLHTGERILALSANAGTILWAYPTQATPRMTEQERQMYMNNYGMVPGSNSHDSVTVYGDQAFAVLPAPQAPQAVRNPNYYAGMQQQNTRLVALNRTTGQEMWSRASHTVKTDAKGNLSFMGSPLVTRQGVFVMARKQGDGTFTQMYMVRLDRETGEPTWACYICSASSGGYYGYNMGNQKIALPTLVDDILYVTTNQGADCAIDANAGRIIWLQITESARKLRDPNEMYQPQVNTTPAWKINPPLVYGDKVVTLEVGTGSGASATGSNIRVYERWTGRLLASWDRKKFDDADVIAGILENKLLLVGKKVSAVDLDKVMDPALKATWEGDFPTTTETGKLQGRPFLAANVLYVPFDKGLVMMNPKDGKLIDYALWPKNEKDQPGKPGNILVTPEQIVVVTDKEIAGYSRWETARDNRLAKIKEKPTDPEPYLSLAEIAFRTNHFELAIENMDKAVGLATAPNSGANEDLLGRLYRTNLNFAEQLLVKTDEAQRDGARFYYTQSKLSARTPEQQAEWRLCMAQLALAQKKPDEAALLYNEVLTDSAMRAAPFQRGEAVSRAGATAEQNFRTLIEKNTPAVYKRFEDQAAAMLATAETGKDPAQLQQVVEAYPNSEAAIKAATLRASVLRDKADWPEEIKSLRWLYTRVNGEAKARTTAELAYANLQMKRFAASVNWTERGLRQYKDFKWTDPSSKKEMTFAAMKDQLREAGAAVSDGRLAILPAPTLDKEGRPTGAPAMDNTSSLPERGIPGSLMAPIETMASARRPDAVLVSSGGKLRVFKADTMSELTAAGAIDVGGNVPMAVLGHYGDFAVILQARKIVCVNLKTMAVAWEGKFDINAEQMNTQYNTAVQVRQMAIQQAQMGGNPAPQVYIDQDGQNWNNPYMQQMLAGLDADTQRVLAFNQLSRNGGREVGFANIRMINNKIVAVVNSQLVAWDIATGKPAWVDRAGNAVSVPLPPGHATAILGNEDLIAVQIDSVDRATPTFYVVDADTGKFRKQIKLGDERAMWRTVSEDGTLFVVTDQAVSAFDLFAEHNRPLWRRDDLRTRYATATTLSLDGLIFVNTNNELMCLSQEGGETRWPQPRSGAIRMQIPGQGQASYLKSTLDGDMVVFQSNQGMAAYYTFPQSSSEDQVAWVAGFTPQTTPPLNTVQMSEPYAVVLASGQLGSTQRAVKLIFVNRKGGKLHLVTPMTKSTTDNEGPMIKAWQVVDNGVAMEYGGKTYVYRGKK